ncbi:hypothetical protein [Thermoflavimicrobium daqui]|uniref:Lipoprotein n=1 Tax=Thermoflavimicrobium daqui TaxID=2137476 RepID=A0A364K722_9BACL|nr:hypothetical protein [Thermoflavimicrobium daqui]RAL26101.1 hypothetical protein DL897_03610 [Thermoflavimicrobium daqui]
MSASKWKRLILIGGLISLLLTACSSTELSQPEEAYIDYLNKIQSEDAKIYTKGLSYIYYGKNKQAKVNYEGLKYETKWKKGGKRHSFRIMIAVHPEDSPFDSTATLLFKYPKEDCKRMGKLVGNEQQIPKSNKIYQVHLKKVDDQWKIDLTRPGTELKKQIEDIDWKEAKMKLEIPK